MKLSRSEIAQMGQAAFRAKTTPEQRSAWARIPRLLKPVRERFNAKWIPEPNSGCWLWLGYTSADGYGRFQLRPRACRLAHRVSWEFERGPIPQGMVLDHTCRNRACVNPDHLRVVTPRVNALENSESPIAKTAAQTRCPKCGGDYYVVAECGKDVRRCRACRKANQANYYQTYERKPRTRWLAFSDSPRTGMQE